MSKKNKIWLSPPHISENEKNKSLNNIILTTDFNLIKDSDLVVEAIIEDIEIKKNIFQRLDSHCKRETILASNTSSISITELAESTTRKEKVIGMHFMNPVPLMNLVELVKGIATSQETYRTFENFVI